MAGCTFFGHRDIRRETIEPMLRSVMIDLIEKKQVTRFYVGCHGNFDNMVRENLRRLRLDYPQIWYGVVLAYLPCEKRKWEDEEDAETIFPYALANTPPKYAIAKRNRRMIDQSDYIVADIQHSWGNAAQFVKLAERKGKIMIPLADEGKWKGGRKEIFP